MYEILFNSARPLWRNGVEIFPHTIVHVGVTTFTMYVSYYSDNSLQDGDMKLKFMLFCSSCVARSDGILVPKSNVLDFVRKYIVHGLIFGVQKLF